MVNRETFLANGAESTLSSSLAQAATTVNVTSTVGFPAVPFYAVIDPNNDSKREVVRATAKTSTTLTVVRGEDSSSDVAHNSGAVIAVVVVAALWTDINDRVEAHTHTGGTDGAPIATSDLTGHTKAAHDALGIATSSLSGHDASAHESFRLVGEVVPYAGSSAPSLWLLCRGQAVSRTTYSDLFAAIGTTFGTGDGSTTFNVPDLQAKFPVGVSTSDADHDLGDTGGEQEHTLTTAEMPSHTHTGPSHTHSFSATSGSGGTHTHDIASEGSTSQDHFHAGDDQGKVASHTTDTASEPTQSNAAESAGSHTHSVSGTTGSGGTGNTGSAGSGSAHENRPPFLSLNFIIFAGA